MQNASRLRIAAACLKGQVVLTKSFFTGQEVEEFIASPGVEADEVYVFAGPMLTRKERVKQDT